MKKIFLIWFIASLFFLFQYQDVNAAGANFSMHTVYSNIDKENQTVTLSWSPISGSEDVEIFISRDGGKEYESLDIVPMDSKSYTYKVQCGEPILYFKFMPRNEDGTSESYKIDTQKIGSSCEGSTYGGANFSMHAMFTNIDRENKSVILSWLPAQGSKDVEISVSRDGGKEYVVLDTVPMDSKSYTYKVQCGESNLMFKFMPRNGDGTSESYIVNTQGVGGECEGADMSKANISYYYKDNAINFIRDNLTGSKNVEIYVSKNGDSTFNSIGTALMKDETYKYTVKSGDQNLIFKFIPKNNSGIESNYNIDLNCDGKKCSLPESKTTSLLGEVSHVINTGDNSIDFRWTRRLEGIEIVVYLLKGNGHHVLDTIPMIKGEYKYRLDCGDEDLLFEFTAKRVEGYDFTYDVHIDPDEEFCDSSFERNRRMQKWEWFVNGDQSEILNNGYTREKNNAFTFALGYGLISAQNINSANLDGDITRAAMAKIISNFAKNVLGLEPDTSKGCWFSDVSKELDDKYGNGITESCQLGIMGIGLVSFKPYENVTRAEFGTILSRLVFGIKDGNPYYEPHLNSLKQYGIMNNIDPSKIENRGNVLLMLMRITSNLNEGKISL